MSQSMAGGLWRTRQRTFWAVTSIVVATTVLHYLTDVRLLTYHTVYRSLYYVAIALAAVQYGRRGGAITAAVVSVLYLPHVFLLWPEANGNLLSDLAEIPVFFFAGILTGGLADAERTQRDRAEAAVAALERANAQLRDQATTAERTRAEVQAVLDSVASGVLTVHDDGQIASQNRAAQALLGTTTDTLPLPVNAYIQAGGRGFQEVTIGERVLGLRGTDLRASDPPATVLVVDDLTDRRQLELQMRRAERLAGLGRLAGGLAHEIRNPLSIVRAAAQTLARDHRETDADVEYFAVMQSEIDRVDRLLEQLLAYAQPRNVAAQMVAVDVVLDRALMISRPYAAQQGVMLDRASVPEAVVWGDPDLIHQALINLLLNAIQATPAGGQVALDVAVVGSLVGLVVRDTGCGIAASERSQIFDPFYTTRPEGTGLGLSVVQQIAQEHKGSVEVVSTPGMGSQFTLWLSMAALESRIPT